MRLSQRMARLGTETAFEVLVRARALEAQGRNIVHLEIGQPDFDTFPNVAMAGIRAIATGQTRRTPACSAGISEKLSSTTQSISASGKCERISATTGRLCTTSPSEEVLTRRTRFMPVGYRSD